MPPRAKPSQPKPPVDEESPKLQTPEKRVSRSRVSAACEACKKRKTKCSGEPPPCQMCQTIGTECIIDLSLDLRRRAAMQQTIFDSKSYQESLNGLIDCVRYGNLEAFHALQAVFRREDTTKDEALAAIHHWSQVSRENMPEAHQGDRLIIGTDKPSAADLRYQASPTMKSDEHLLRTPSDTSSKLRPQEEKEPESASNLRVLVRRLRTCSTAEGEQLLRTLLSTGSVPDVQSNVMFDDAGVHDDPRSERTVAHMIDGANAEHPRTYWHPALQIGAGSFVTHFAGNEMPSFHGETRTSRQQYDAQLLVDHTSIVSTEARDVPEFLTSEPDSMSKDLSFKSPTSLQGGGRAYPSSIPFNVPKPPMADLLVIKEGTSSPMMIPIHLVQPLLVPDDSSLSRIYTDYLYGAREMIANKTPISDVLGPTDDIIVDLFFRERQHQDQWDCSSWASETSRGFTEFEIYVRLAGVLMLTRLMQWMIFPTAESYAKVPDIMKPTAAQRTVPHIGAIDLLPMPCIRDAVIEKPQDWLTPLAQARWTVNWPYFQDDAVEYDPIIRSRRLTRRFIEHVSNYDNWSVGSQFLDSFPDVAGRIRIHN